MISRTFWFKKEKIRKTSSRQTSKSALMMNLTNKMLTSMRPKGRQSSSWTQRRIQLKKNLIWITCQRKKRLLIPSLSTATSSLGRFLYLMEGQKIKVRGLKSWLRETLKTQGWKAFFPHFMFKILLSKAKGKAWRLKTLEWSLKGKPQSTMTIPISERDHLSPKANLMIGRSWQVATLESARF